MIISTTAVLIDPARMAEADAMLMMMYGSLSALVGAYFDFSGGAVKSNFYPVAGVYSIPATSEAASATCAVLYNFTVFKFSKAPDFISFMYALI